MEEEYKENENVSPQSNSEVIESEESETLVGDIETE